LRILMYLNQNSNVYVLGYKTYYGLILWSVQYVSKFLICLFISNLIYNKTIENNYW